MKLTIGRYQTATQVKVFSPVITNIKEADSVMLLSGSIICFDNARNRLLFRGLSSRYDIEWKLWKHKRTLTFFVKNCTKSGHARYSKSQLTEVNIPLLLAIRTKEYSKEKEYYKLKKQVSLNGVKAVGLTCSRGVAGAMSCEEETVFHSKGLALVRRDKEIHSPETKLEKNYGNKTKPRNGDS